MGQRWLGIISFASATLSSSSRHQSVPVGRQFSVGRQNSIKWQGSFMRRERCMKLYLCTFLGIFSSSSFFWGGGVG